MKFRDICKSHDIDESVYTNNRKLLKLISFWMSENLQLIVEPLKDKVKKLSKKLSTIEQSMTDIKKQSSQPKPKQSEKVIQGTTFITHYRNCILFHRYTYPIKSILKQHKFSWKPDEKGWVRQKPLNIGQLLDEIKREYPLIEFQESEQDTDLL